MRTDEYFSIACWRWLAAVARLPGKAFHVGVLLWHLRNLLGSHTVRWQPSKAEEFGVSRHATYRALQVIERAGFVTIKRHVGRCPLVTIIDVDSAVRQAETENEQRP